MTGAIKKKIFSDFLQMRLNFSNAKMSIHEKHPSDPKTGECL